MTFGFVLNMLVSAVVLAVSVGAFYVCWRVARAHDAKVRRAALLERDLKLAALRQVGMDRSRPYDVRV